MNARAKNICASKFTHRHRTPRLPTLCHVAAAGRAFAATSWRRQCSWPAVVAGGAGAGAVARSTEVERRLSGPSSPLCCHLLLPCLFLLLLLAAPDPGHHLRCRAFKKYFFSKEKFLLFMQKFVPVGWGNLEAFLSSSVALFVLLLGDFQVEAPPPTAQVLMLMLML